MRGTKEDIGDPVAIRRDPPLPVVTRPPIRPRVIDVAFASIVKGDLRLGELCYNNVTGDRHLVLRSADGTIIRFAETSSRSI